MDHIYRASFNPIVQNNTEYYQDLLQEQCKKIINTNEKVEIGEYEQYLTEFPYLLRLILSLYYTLSKKLHYTQSLYLPFINNPLSIPLKYSLLKHLASIIQKKLFVSSNSQKLYEQISHSLVFKPSLFPFMFSLLSQNTNYIHLDKLVAFYKTLTSNQYSHYLAINMYHLYGGGLFTIQLKVFKEKISNMIESMGRALSTSETIVNRNIQQFKSNKERAKFLQESVKTVMMSKNKQALADIVNYITTSIFASKEYLQKEQFLAQLQSKPIEPTLTIFLLLARSEALLFEERHFRNQLLVRSQITKTNFYANQMTKLFNKCPFNGDERCDCKKCLCVRRNRESAKLNQQKKRNAVEQVQNFKMRIAELEERDRAHEKMISELQEKQRRQAKKNIELEQQNLMLKTLLKEMKANPNIKMLMMQTIEPVSKVLNNDL